MRRVDTITLFPLIITMFCSCHAQDDTRVILKNTDTQEPNSVSTSRYTDPLFFIDGQLCQHVREIYQDSQGNLWFGTNVYDLMKYDGDTLVYITAEDGFSGGRVTGFLEDVDGVLWIGTSSGLVSYDGEQFKVYDEDEGLENSEIWSLYLDQGGVMWIGHNGGLSRFDGGTFDSINVPYPSVQNPNTIYSKERITAIAEDPDGQLWLGTDGYGIVRYDGKAHTHFTKVDGLADNTISDLMVDSAGNLWIGTFFGGVSRYDGEHFHNYTMEGEASGVEVGGLFEDRNGAIWFAAENNGVYQYDGSKFTHYPAELFNGGSILSIYRDQEDRLWLGGWGGLFRMIDGEILPIPKDGPWH